MIQVIATNLTQVTTKNKSEDENIKLGFTEYLPFSRNQTLNQLSGELPLVQLTFTIEEDDFAENEQEKRYVIDNSYMLLANNVKEVMSDFLINYAHYNYDAKSTMMPISYEGYNQETDAKILSIRFYPRKFRQDQVLCRCYIVVPKPLEKEDIAIIEDLLHKKINNIETEIEAKQSKAKEEDNNDKLPEELSSVKIGSDAENSFEESVCIVVNDAINNNTDEEDFVLQENVHSNVQNNLRNNIEEDDDINFDNIVSSSQNNNMNKDAKTSKSAEPKPVEDDEDVVFDNINVNNSSTVTENKLTQPEQNVELKKEKNIFKQDDSLDGTRVVNTVNAKSVTDDKKSKRLNDKISQYLEFMTYVEDGFSENDEDDDDFGFNNENFLQSFSQHINTKNNTEEAAETLKEDDVDNTELIKNTAEEQEINSVEDTEPIYNEVDDTTTKDTKNDDKLIELQVKQDSNEIKNIDNNETVTLNNLQEDIVIEKAELIQDNVESEITTTVEIEKNVKTEYETAKENKTDVILNNNIEKTELTTFMSEELTQYTQNYPDTLQSVFDKIDENKELFIEIFDNLAEYKTVSKKDVLNAAFSKVIKFFKNNEKTQVVLAQRDENAKKELLQCIEQHIDNYVTEIPNDDKTLLNSMVKRALLSYYVLTPLINDNTISDIKVLSYDKINIKKSGLHYTVTNLSFIDETDYKSFIDNLIERYQVPINSMFLVFSDIDFNKDYRLRFNISLPFVNSTGLPYLHIRKVPKNKLSMTDLIDAKMMTPEIALYLIDAIRNKSILISGPSASGKTNLANALVDMIPYEYSGLVIQESEELFSDKHPNLMFQHIIKNCDLEALGTNGLLCDAGYFIIGEIKGKEARNFSKAAATGHKCMATIHASSSAKSIDRLVDYIRLGDKNYTTEDSLRLIQDMNVLVFVKDFKIQEIDEVVGIHENGQELIYKPIYRYNSNLQTE